MNTQKEVVAAKQHELRQAAPAVDVEQDDSCYIVRAVVPGAVKDSAEIHLKDGVIEFEVKADWTQAGEYRQREFAPVVYKRRFKLGNDIDQDSIRASMDNGVLVITLPRRESAKPRRIELE